jgi:hypothetical protein
MACDISSGRVEQCKDSVAGLQAIYFINYNTGSYTVNANDVITAFPSGSVVYKYELKGANSYTETVNTSRDNGTTFFSQGLNIQIKRLDATATKEFKLLAYGRPKIVIHTRNGEAFLAGLLEGCDMTAGTIASGQAYGDLVGYTATFTGNEKLPANFISGSTAANPFAAIPGITVVQGTPA